VLLLVPAHRRLHGSIDQAIGHVRRYERHDLETSLRDAGFEVETVAFVNRLGAIGWYLNSVLLRRRRVPGLQVRLQDLLVPLIRAEGALPLPFGLSLLAIGRKPAPGVASAGSGRPPEV
jgi:hypothetical protein